MKNFNRVFDLLPYQAEKFSGQSAVNVSSGGTWKTWSISTLLTGVNRTAHYLQQLGLQAGDKLVLIPGSGHLSWLLMDFACQQLGVVVVPLHATTSLKDLVFILAETEARACLVQEQKQWAGIDELRHKGQITLPLLWHLTEDQYGYLDLEAVGEDPSYPATPPDTAAGISPESVFCIMYTSGTTGSPKGVMLTHANMTANIKSVLALLPLEPHHRVLSFLPLSHIFERMALYTYLAFGVSIYFSRSRDTILEDFQTAQPHFFTSVPRVLEKYHEFLVQEQLRSKWLRKKLFKWALRIGSRFGDHSTLDFRYWLQLLLARWLVLGRIKKRMGGKLIGIFVGAAALNPEMARLFSAAGIRVREGYGLTETAPVIATNRFEPGMNLFGSVGLPVPGVRIRIHEPNEEGIGEVQVQGPNVMKGYYKNPNLTREAFTEDGWFKTGDTGRIINKRFLQIVGRKVDVFKTSAGKFISPEELETQLDNSPFIEDCLVIGFNRPYLTAILIPNVEVLQSWCQENQIHWTAPAFMIHNIKVIDRFRQELDTFNQSLPNHQRIRQFHLSADTWSVENGAYALTLKKIRKTLLARYQQEIERMYERGAG